MGWGVWGHGGLGLLRWGRVKLACFMLEEEGAVAEGSRDIVSGEEGEV